MRILPTGNGHMTPLSPSTPIQAAIPGLTLQETNPWQPDDSGGKNTSVRWAANRMPLSVYIEPPPNDSDWPPETLLMMLKQLKQWEQASLGGDGKARIQFRQHYQADEADITLHWVDETALGRDNEVGHAKRSVDHKGLITRVAITLISNPAIDQELSPEARQKRLQATVLHEVGHALGLEHGEHAADVMHHQGWRNLFFTENDCARLQALYQNPESLWG